jgi:hypothetical protein
MKDEYSQLIDQHQQWLNSFEEERLKQWKNSLNNNIEAALCEAATRKLLVDHGCNVEPFEDRALGGVDFKCSKNSNAFYVEATCITKEVASTKSGLTDSFQSNKATYYEFLTRTIWQELSNKTLQCSGLDAPCIVVIGTFHFQAGCLCFDDLAIEELLTGITYITKRIDAKLGKAVGETYESTKLESAAFIRPNESPPNFFEYARCPISAVLLCPFGTEPIKTIGVIHPNPNYPFKRDLLSDIKFCKLNDNYKHGLLKVEWI